MFIRFVSGEIDEDSHVSAGLFHATHKLLDEIWLPDYEYSALMEEVDWFGRHLKVPFEYRLRPRWRAWRSICWFRHTAHEHLARAWEIVGILEMNDIYMRVIKSDNPGCVLYEDEAQILAYPSRDLRRLL